ncbi:MAG: hypothetical protein KC425_26015, partial [Anaerolineales bacterium]|nr:hypothetical protein [Anaerolineales bacterium]
MNSRIKISLHILAIALLLFLLSWWSMSSLTFLQSDTGLRFWQTRELIAREWSSFAIRYPAQAFDPDLRFVPFYCAYSIVQGKLFFEITPFVPLLASFLFPRLGAAGLAVVPALSGTLIALGMYYLARLGGLRRPYLLLWGSVLATPLFFYTLQLWDHSPAVACAVWGVYGAARGLVQRRWPPLFWGGVVLAVGLGQRPEMYLFVLALAASALLVHRQQWRLLPALAGGGLLGVLPIWWFQLAWFGHPFGMAFAPHLFGYGRPPAHVFTCQAPGSALRYGRFLMYIDGRDLQSFAAALLAIGALFLLLLGLRMPRLRRPWLLLSALALAAVGYALWGEMMWHSLLPGLLTTCPFLGLSLAYLEQNEDGSPTRPVYRLVFFTTLLFLVGM